MIVLKTNSCIHHCTQYKIYINNFSYLSKYNQTFQFSSIVILNKLNCLENQIEKKYIFIK